MVIENDYKKEVKAKILELATTMFFQHGIRKVKMDDIAARLKISKRTLYEIYQNKEDLLYEVVVLNDKRGLEKLEEFDKPGVNVINFIIHVFKLQTEEFSRINPVFLEDIGKYPKLMEYIQNKRKRKRKQVVAFIERGISEGCFLPDINIEIMNTLADASGHYIMSNNLYNKYNIKEIFRTVVLLYIRGICTEKGIKLLDEEMKGF